MSIFDTTVVPNPTTVPESPLYERTSLLSEINEGGSIRTCGAVVYPVPPDVTVILVTDPLDTVAVAVAVDPSPTGVWIDTEGVDAYPFPPSTTAIEETEPLDIEAETVAPILASWLTIVILSYTVVRILWSGFSFLGSKNGLTLST